MNDSFAMTQEQILVIETSLDSTQWGIIIFGLDGDQRDSFIKQYPFIYHSKIPHKIEHLDALLEELPDENIHGCIIELPFWRDNKDEEFLKKANQVINHFSPIGFKRMHHRDHADGFAKNPTEPNGGYWMESHGEETYIFRFNGQAENVTGNYPKEYVECRLQEGVWVEF